MKTTMWTFAFAVFLGGLPLVANGQVYKCVDPSTKKTTYSGAPCAAGDEKKLSITENAIMDGAAAQQEIANRAMAAQGSYVAGPCSAGSSYRDSEVAKGRLAYAQAQQGGMFGNSGTRAVRDAQAEVNANSALATGGCGVSAELPIDTANRIPPKVAKKRNTPEDIASQNAREIQNPQRDTYVGPPVMCADGSYVANGPCRMCPNGRYVGGEGGCQMTPDGGYVSRGSAPPQMAPNGRYVEGGAGMAMCSDGSYVPGNRCVMAPNGRFVGQ